MAYVKGLLKLQDKASLDLRKKQKLPYNPVSENASSDCIMFGDTIYVIQGIVKHDATILNAMSAEGICNDAVTMQDLEADGRNLRLSLFVIEAYINSQKSQDPENIKQIQSSQKGRPVRFGDYIQLRHLHSQRLMKLELKESVSDLQSFKILINPTESTCIQIEPNGSHIQPGHTISYYDSFFIACKIFETTAYLNFSADKLQASSYNSLWHIRQFKTHNIETDSIVYGSPITITSPGDLKLSCPSGKLAFDNNEKTSHHCYWMLERQLNLLGGEVKGNQIVTIKNLTLKKYIGPNLALVDTFPEAQAFTVVSSQEQVLKNGAIVGLHTEDDRYITKDFCPSTPDIAIIMNTNSDLRSAPKFQGGLKLATTKRLKEAHCLQLNKANKSQTFFFVQVAEVIPYIQTLAGYLPKKGLEEAIETFGLFCEHACRFLSVSLEDQIGKPELELRQNFLLNTQVHTSLLEICFFIENERVKYSDTPKLLKALLGSIYHLLKILSVNNTLVSEFLTRSDSILRKLLVLNPVEAGPFVIQIYHQSYYAGEDPKSYIRKWVKKLDTVNEENLNLQCRFAEALVGFCMRDEEVFPPLQQLTANMLLFSSDSFTFYKIAIVSDTLALTFNYKNVETTHKEFLEANPNLQSLVFNVDSQIWFSLEGISLTEYAGYVSDVMFLFATICPDPEGSEAEYVKQTLGFSEDILTAMIFNDQLHPLIRSSAVRLFGQLYVQNLNVPSFMEVTSKNRCFKIDELSTEHTSNKFKEVRTWLVEYWQESQSLVTDRVFSRDSKIILIESILQLCYTMLDTFLFDSFEVNMLNEFTVSLLDGLIESDPSMLNSWVAQLLSNVDTGKKYFSQEINSLVFQLLRFRYLLVKRAEYDSMIEALNEIAREVENPIEPDEISIDSETAPLNLKKKVAEKKEIELLDTDLRLVKGLFSERILEIRSYELLIKLQKRVTVPKMHMLVSLSKVELINSAGYVILRQKLDSVNMFISKRAKWEPILQTEILSGNSSSCASETIEYMANLCNCFEYRTADNDFLTSVQTAMRNSRIYKSVTVLWDFLTTMPQTEQVVDLTRLCAVFCYFFVHRNSINKRLLKKLIHQRMFSYEIDVVPYLVRSLQEFSEFDNKNVESLIKDILDKTMSGEKATTALHWLHAMMFPYESSTPNILYQSLVGSMAIEHFRMKSAEYLLNPQPHQLSALLSLLSRTAVDSRTASMQLRKLFSFRSLVRFTRGSGNRIDCLRASLEFATVVYFFSEDVTIEDCPEKSIVEFLNLLHNPIFEAIHDMRGLCQLAREGLYELVFPKFNDSLIDLNRGKQTHELAEYWRLVAEGSTWNYSAGLVVSLPVIKSFVSRQSAHHLKNLEAKITVFEKAFIQLYTDIEKCSFDNPELDFSQLLKLLQSFEGFNRRATLRTQTDNRRISPIIDQGHKDAVALYCTKHEEMLPPDSKSHSKILALMIRRLDILANIEQEEYNEEDVTKASEAFDRLLYVARSTSQMKLYYSTIRNLLVKKGFGQVNFNRIFWSSNLIEYILKQILQSTNIVEAFDAAETLAQLCSRQTRDFQIALLEFIHNNDIADFFILIRRTLINVRFGLFSSGKSGRAARYFADFSPEQVSNKIEDGVLSEINFACLLLRIMKSCCDNCCEPFQVYFHKQDYNDVVLTRQTDLVSEIRNLVIDLAYQQDLNQASTIELLRSGLEVMIDLVTGPCEVNQKLLGGSPQLILALNIILMKTSKLDLNIFNTTQRTHVYALCIKFLLALLEGDQGNSDGLKNIRNFLEIKSLIAEADKIYKYNIKGYERIHALQKISNDQQEIEEETISPESVAFAAIGIDIVMLLLILHEDFKQNYELTAYLEAEFKVTKFKLWIEQIYRPYVEHTLPEETINYYLSYIGYVEISFKKRVQRCYFPIPYKVKFLTHYSKRSFIDRVDRTSKSTLNKDFFDRIVIGYREVGHQQKLAHNKVLKMLCNSWGGFWLLSFYISLATNLTLLGLVTDRDQLKIENAKNADEYIILAGPAILILLTAFLGQLFYTIAYAPVIAIKKLIRKPPYTIKKYRNTIDNDSILMRKISAFSIQAIYDEYNNMPLKEYFKILLLDRSFLYFLLYCGTIGLCFYNPIFYSFTLMSFIFMSKNVTSILKSITMSLGALLRTGILGLAFINIFATIALYSFSNLDFFQHGEDKEPNFATYCDDLYNCFFTIIDYGIRTGGGIGEAMRSPLKDEDYNFRVFYDIAFFIIVIVVMLKIIFGIILDNFGMLRDANQEHERVTNSKCYICDLDRSKLQLHGKGWAFHIMNEHSIYAYFSFVVYIMDKDMYECNGIEKHVKECINENRTDFLPMNSKFLEESNARTH